MAGESAASYLADLGSLLRDMAFKAKADRDEAEGEERVYLEGRLMAFVEVISLMQQQAEAFQLQHADLGLEGVDPERELL